MRVIWGILSAVLAIVFLAGLFMSLGGKRKAPHGTASSMGSREVDPAGVAASPLPALRLVATEGGRLSEETRSR
jgi:hypothetical protein